MPRPNKEPQFSQEQYDMLMRCSEKKDITEWNEWRRKNPLEGICLEGADLENANLEGADFRFAHLEGANLCEAQLKRANFHRAHLEGADLKAARLKEVKLQFAHLEGTDFTIAFLEGADFTATTVDGLTIFLHCPVDRETNFRTVALESCRIDEGTKYLLEYNKRRMNCEDWYSGRSKNKYRRMLRQVITSPARLFLWISDYGRSVPRILITFFGLAFTFAFLYWKFSDCVIVNGQVGELRNFLHALYFSVVTMTTLGFGDIAANPNSPLGQVLLMVQVLWGYVLLGALVTRFGVLFNSGVVLSKFAKRSKSTKNGKNKSTS